ncbi:MAG: DUF3810 domain-containing protein [Armatimonadota bacterium]|nr:DUF3810 domain-containing protein [Armatimonadota bacterium]
MTCARRANRGWRIGGWILLALSAAAQRWAPPDLVERVYVARVYPGIAPLLSAVNAPFPFSLAECLCAVLPLGALAAWIRRRRRGSPAVRPLDAATWVAAAAGYVGFLFSLSWGLHYRRPPMAARMGLPVAQNTLPDLVETARWLAEEAARLTPEGPGDAPTSLPLALHEVNRQVEAAYAALPGPALSLGPAKPVLASGLLSRLGLSGFYFPFTGEPNFNRLMPHAEIPFAIAHEKAHQRGIAPENEANFAAFLALSSAAHPYLRYSGFLNAAGYALNALARADPAAYRDLVRLLKGRPAADRAAIRRFWTRYRGPAEQVAQRVNDLYLRANRVPGGVRSYGAVTDLLVAYRKATIASSSIPGSSASSLKSKPEE